MAGKGTIGGKIVLEGEAKYREALKGIKSEQAQLRSEMKLCQSSFKDNQNSLVALETKYGVLTRQVDAQAKKVAVYSEALQSSHKAEADAAKKVADLQTALEEANAEMTDMGSNADCTAESLQEQGKQVDELKRKLALANQDYDKAVQKTASYQTSLNYATDELNNMQRELQQTESYMKEAESSTDKCAASIDEYGKETQIAAEKTDIFADVLKANLLSDAIREGIRKLAEGIKKIASSAVESGTQFEASMSQVAATMGMTADEVENGSREYTLLSEAAKKCGKETMFSASQAGEALNYLALAGYEAKKSTATLPKVLDLAAAGGLDLAYASDLVTDSMAALSMETDQLDSYIDQMARTSQKSNTSVSQLGEATLVCAGTVSLTGQSIETMNTELGILANNGIKGAEGGTHLRNILLSLSAPTEKAEIALNQLGVQVSDSSGNMRDLNNILIDMDKSMAGLSSTEKTRTINSIFNKTDIAAVNALLKGAGDEFSNLRGEIESSSGAAAMMAETLNNNLKGKVTILQSALEGLGISAYEIFDDEMKMSVDSATEAVGRLQKSMDSGDLGVSLRKFSKELGELVNGAAEFGEDALPVVIDGFTWLMENSEIVASGIAGVAAATVYHSSVAPAIMAVTSAWTAYKTANEGATVSQWLLNAAMDANPAGILVTAIVGVTAAMAAFVAMGGSSATILDENTQKSKELAEQAKELNDAYAEGSASRTASRTEMETEASTCRKLVRELDSLQSKTSLTAQEQGRQQAIISQLNQVMPELNLAIDEQTGKLSSSTRELEKNVDAMMNQAKAEAAREDLAQIAQEQYEAEKMLAELEAQREVQVKELEKAQAEYNERIEQSNETTLTYAETMGTMAAQSSDNASAYAASMQEMNDAEIAMAVNVEQAKAAQEELDAQINATRDTIQGYTDEYANTLDYISNTEPVDIASAAIEVLGNAAASTGQHISVMSAQTQQAFNDMYDSVSESIAEQMDLFAEWDGKMVTTGTNMLANMQSQVDGLQNWADNIQELAERGISKGLLQKLADMGPEGAGYVAAFVDMTEEELKKANELYVESLSLSDDTAVKVAESYANVAENAVQGMTDKLSESEGIIKDAGAEISETLVKSTKTVLGIQSPSKVYKEIGQFMIQGLIAGVKGEQGNAASTVDNLTHSLVTKAQTGLASSKFVEIGKQITNGLITGINSGSSGVVQAIQNMCTKAVESAKASLDIHSPSKEFAYLGKMSGEGYKVGLTESMSNINAVVAASMPHYEKEPVGAAGSANIPESIEARKDVNIEQKFYIYGDTPGLIETSRKFKKWQREAARDW